MAGSNVITEGNQQSFCSEAHTQKMHYHPDASDSTFAVHHLFRTEHSVPNPPTTAWLNKHKDGEFSSQIAESS